ncbi:MAG: site-specific integrase [Roseiflexaceae bacterium]
MNEHVEKFIAYLVSERNLTPNTTSAYRTDLNQFLSFMATRKVSDMSRAENADIMAFILFLRETQYTNATEARSTAAMVVHHPEAKYFSIGSAGQRAEDDVTALQS